MHTFLLSTLIAFTFLLGTVFADDKPIEQPVATKPAKPRQFCEPQLYLTQTHLEKVTRDMNTLALRDTASELQIQSLSRQLADLKKKLEEATKPKEAKEPDGAPLGSP